MRISKYLIISIVLEFFCISFIYAQENIFVSTKATETQDGSFQNPFKTLNGALEKVSKLNKNLTQNINIFIREGIYYLDSTIAITPNIFLSNKYSLSITAFENEEVIISGAKPVKNWVNHQGNIYKADVGDPYFRDLYLQNRRATRARHPNKCDYYRIEEWVDTFSLIKTYKKDLDIITDIDLNNPPEMHIKKHWALQIMRVKEIYKRFEGDLVDCFDTEKNVIFGRENPQRSNGQFYHLENHYNFLDEPEEWFLDSETGTLYFYAENESFFEENTVLIPQLENLLVVEGIGLNKINNVTVKGITFKHNTWRLPKEVGFAAGQASYMYQYIREQPYKSAILFEDANYINVSENRFEQLGTPAIMFHHGVKESIIEGNLLDDVGGNGIVIDWAINTSTGPSQKSKNIKISNNYITNIGSVYFGSVGIFLGFTDSVTVENNYLKNLPYTGISLGWHGKEWNEIKDNIIRNNLLDNVMNMLEDGGAIYTLEPQVNTRVYNNVIRNVNRSPWNLGNEENWPVAGIYLDNFSNNINVYENLILNAFIPYRVSSVAGSGNQVSNHLVNINYTIETAGITEEFLHIIAENPYYLNCADREFKYLTQDLQSYPNPAQTEINIIYNPFATNDFNYSIIDVNGKKLISGSVEQNSIYKLTININSIESGLYVIILTDNNKRLIGKSLFIKN
jgi:hypothetical protein